MPVRTAHCPSGLRVNVRGLKIKEANMLADATMIRKGVTFDMVLKAVTLDVENIGIYKAPFDWRKALVCDRFYTLLQARIATYGPVYEFDLQCKSPTCRKPIAWDVNLETDLEYRDLPEESKATFEAGNEFKAVIPSTGREFTFQLMTGELEAMAAEQMRKRRDRIMSLSLNARIKAIDGVEGNDKPRVIDDMDLGDATEILDILDLADGGAKTDLEVECQECGTLQSANLPFDREFWLPSKRRAKTTS